jgi:hypothetical protein
MLKENNHNETIDVIKTIEQCENDAELSQILITLRQSVQLNPEKLKQYIIQNDNMLKNTLLENTDSIVKLFSSTKHISEELQKSKKSIDMLASQMLM